MSLSTETKNRINALLTVMVDDKLADEQRSELESILLESIDAQHFYVDFISLNSELTRLHVDASRPTDDASDPHVHTVSRSWLKRASRRPVAPSIAVAVIGIAALLVVLAVTPVSQFFATKDNAIDRDKPAPASAQEIATITGWHRIDWKDGYRLSGQDHRLRAGQKVAMLSGLAEITYDTGAKVVLEGPCEFVVGGKAEGGGLKAEGEQATSAGLHSSSFILHSSNSGFLNFGRLVARVDGERAQGFVINTPYVRIEDFGTEFGVRVEKDGATEAVVFEGEIEFAPSTRGDSTADAVRLKAGEAASRQRGDAPIESAAPRTKFVRLSEATKRFALAQQLPEAAVITGTVATDASHLDTRSAIQTINGSGLTGGGDNDLSAPWTGEGNILTAVHSGGGLRQHVFLGELNGQQLVYAFPRSLDLIGVHVWQYSNTNTKWNLRGIKSVAMSFSTDGGQTYERSVVLSFEPGRPGEPEPAQSRSFDERLGVTHVKLSEMTNFGDPVYIGLAEIRFQINQEDHGDTENDVPENETTIDERMRPDDSQ